MALILEISFYHFNYIIILITLDTLYNTTQYLSRTRQRKWAKIGPLSPFSSCPRISQSGQGARAALWAALWPDSGRPSAGPGRPFGPPLVLRGGPKGRPGRPGGPKGRPSGRPFFEGRPERRPFFCKGRPHFEGGRPAATDR